MKVVYKEIDDENEIWVWVWTLDGRLRFSFHPTWSLYSELDVVDTYEVEVRKGALGYPWWMHKHAFEFWRE